MVKTPKLGAADRDGLLRSGFSSMVMEGAGGMTTSPVWSKVASEKQGEKILVIVELSGGNDGLNTVVPYQNDA